MKPPVLLLAALVLKVMILSPSGQAQTTDPVEHFQPLRKTTFPTVNPTSISGSFTINKCAAACLNYTSCRAFRWLRGILFSNTCNLYKMVETPISASDSDLYFKFLPTTMPTPTQSTQPSTTQAPTQSTQPTTTQAKCVSAPTVGPGVWAGVAIATTVAGFVLGALTSQLVQWCRSQAKGKRDSRQADLEEEPLGEGHLLPLPLPRTDQTEGGTHVHYDVPTEGGPVRRQSSGLYQELQPVQYHGLVHESDGDQSASPYDDGDDGEYVEPELSLAREDSNPTGNYESVDDSYLELQP